MRPATATIPDKRFSVKYLNDPPHPDRARFYLFRHGHLANSELHVINGRTDVSLSRRGHFQMKAWKDRFISTWLDGLLSSTLKRTVDSVKVLSGERDIPLQSLSGFCERSFGEWEGMTRTDISRKDPAGYRKWLEIDPVFAPPGGESLTKFRDRVLMTLSGILEIPGFGKNLLMVGHSGVNRILLLEALGLSLEHYFRISQDYACLNIIDFFRSGPPVVHLLNVPPVWSEEGIDG